MVSFWIKLQELIRERQYTLDLLRLGDIRVFSDLEATLPSSIKEKRRIKKSYTNKPVRLYTWNQPITYIESFSLTVLRYKK